MIDPALAQALRALIGGQRIAALGTLHAGEPYVSMVPFALAGSPPRLVVHVSALAAHTKDMLQDPRVSVLVAAQPGPDVAPQAVPRVTIQGDAAMVDEGDAAYAAARTAYLARFPESEPMFGFGDFSIFAIAPRSLRLVAGFAQAKTITPETFAEAMKG
jgi:heme oxygenase (biliverdin-IX-beta and delta-forming)